MVVAKTPEAQTQLVRATPGPHGEARLLGRGQRVFVPPGDVEPPSAAIPQRTKMAVVGRTAHGQAGLTHWTVLEQFEQYAWVECRLATGRTHQIRVPHGPYRPSPGGDPVYGGRELGGAAPVSSPGLHAPCAWAWPIPAPARSTWNGRRRHLLISRNSSHPWNPMHPDWIIPDWPAQPREGPDDHPGRRRQPGALRQLQHRHPRGRHPRLRVAETVACWRRTCPGPLAEPDSRQWRGPVWR